jgi:hypothetical protein
MKGPEDEESLLVCFPIDPVAILDLGEFVAVPRGYDSCKPTSGLETNT